MKSLVALLILLSMLICPVQGQDHQDTDLYNNWNIRISPYFWFVGFKGTIYRPPQPAQFPIPEPSKEIDVSFRDIQNNLKFALMIAAEYRRIIWRAINNAVNDFDE